MDILYLLVHFAAIRLRHRHAVFWWSLKSGQYEDLEVGHRILMDDDRARTCRKNAALLTQIKAGRVTNR
ncbi:MAG: cbb3-type cytochrome oxidase assembly protein CcoS, partial [Sulfuritalea sp.]|nr:cbb3-type cytochrome oxidase assembly protein CcoS [Sulfuritalea sp.]